MHGDFRIGAWLIQPQLHTIARDAQVTHVEPKAMQVLVYLAEHADQVVPKERLISAVWTDTFVTDDVLIRCISELRKAFDEDAKDPKVIGTIPRGGIDWSRQSYPWLRRKQRPQPQQSRSPVPRSAG